MSELNIPPAREMRHAFQPGRDLSAIGLDAFASAATLYPSMPAPVQRMLDAYATIKDLSSAMAIQSQQTSIQTEVASFFASVEAGEPVPPADELATRINGNIRRHAEAQDRGNIARALHSQLPAKLQQVIATNIDGLLTGLRDQLDTLLPTIAKSVADLGTLDVTNADAVAAATTTQREAHVALLTQHAPAYQQLRMLQRLALVNSSLDPIGYTAWTAGWTWESTFSDESACLEINKGTALAPSMPLQRIIDVGRNADRIWLPSIADAERRWNLFHHGTETNPMSGKTAAMLHSEAPKETKSRPAPGDLIIV